MLKKWINSGEHEHALICEHPAICEDAYHGGTGIIFDFVNLQEEELS